MVKRYRHNDTLLVLSDSDIKVSQYYISAVRQAKVNLHYDPTYRPRRHIDIISIFIKPYSDR